MALGVGHPSPFHIGKNRSPHQPFCTCSSQSGTAHCSPHTASITILSHFILAARLCHLFYSMLISVSLSHYHSLHPEDWDSRVLKKCWYPTATLRGITIWWKIKISPMMASITFHNCGNMVNAWAGTVLKGCDSCLDTHVKLLIYHQCYHYFLSYPHIFIWTW